MRPERPGANPKAIAISALLAGLCACSAAALAQNFASKVVRVVNPAAPGGNSDILFRLLQPKMSEVLGQPVVMDYRPGAGSLIGIDVTAKAAPDGYTTALVAAAFQINPAVRAKVNYDAVKHFTPLGLIVDLPAGLTVHPSMPVKSEKWDGSVQLDGATTRRKTVARSRAHASIRGDVGRS